jgi:hypothetical protein
MRRAVAVAAVIATAEGMRVRKRREGGMVGGEERKLDDYDEARDYSMGWDRMGAGDADSVERAAVGADTPRFSAATLQGQMSDCTTDNTLLNIL